MVKVPDSWSGDLPDVPIETAPPPIFSQLLPLFDWYTLTWSVAASAGARNEMICALSVMPNDASRF
jgi:hypothetical protein